jgi:hypothetical protein
MQSPYAGMTLNERIVIAGTLAEWDEAVKAGNRERMIQILELLDLKGEAEALADQILSNPKLYGFDIASSK